MIHPTAVIDPKAELGKDLEIGPYVVIEAGARIGDRSRLMHHSSIGSNTEIGVDNEIFPYCSIGQRTQDLKYKGEPTHLTIGSNNVFREFVSINRGTSPGAFTTVGSHNTLLAYAHIAHDCVVGNHVIFSNNGTLGGHVIVEDHAIVGGLSAVHQFCRIGRHSMIGGCTKIVQDVPPYFIADGNPSRVRSLNLVGLQRNGFSRETIQSLRSAYRILYDETLNTSQALEQMESELGRVPEVRILLDFVKKSERGIIR